MMSNNKKRKVQESLFGKYKWWFIIVIVMLVIGYLVIYICFVNNGILSAGVDLEKKDWLAFLGSYLAFAGTVAVSAIAMLQSQHFTEQQRERDFATRKWQLQPVFSIEITAVNSRLDGVAEAFNPPNLDEYPNHKNVTFKIENVGEYPIRNVIIFEKYLYQLLKPHDVKTFQIAYSDSPDMKRWRNKLIEVLETDCGRSEDGLPLGININYDDIDGNGMYQSFELKNFEGTDYYSLSETSEV